jgi:hypothetical protein
VYLARLGYQHRDREGLVVIGSLMTGSLARKPASDKPSCSCWASVAAASIRKNGAKNGSEAGMEGKIDGKPLQGANSWQPPQLKG